MSEDEPKLPKRLVLPEIFFELNKIPFLSCRLKYRTSNNSSKREWMEDERVYEFKLAGMNSAPRLTLKVFGDGTYKKWWGSEYSKVTFEHVITEHKLSPKVKKTLAFYVDIL